MVLRIYAVGERQWWACLSRCEQDTSKVMLFGESIKEQVYIFAGFAGAGILEYGHSFYKLIVI